MPSITIRFGALLALLGFVSYYSTHASTSLIPTYFGLVLMFLGILSRTEDVKKRMLWMHIAVTVGLIGFIVPLARAAGPGIQMARGFAVARPRAVAEQLVMALICLIYTALCVRSFIAARRARG